MIDTQDRNIIVADSVASRRDEIIRCLKNDGISITSHKSAWELLGDSDIEQANCLILDNDLEGLSATNVLKRFNGSGFRAPPVIIVGPDNTHAAVRAMQLGAVDYLPNPVSMVLLLDSISRINRSLISIQSKAIANPEVDAIRIRMNSLSKREREVLAGIEAQLTSDQIAYDLTIAKSTVTYHRRNISRKMQAQNLPDLMRMVTLVRNSERSGA